MGRESVRDGSIPGCFLPKPCFSEGCFPPLLTLPCTPPVGSQGETAWAPLAIWGTSTARVFCCIPSLRPGALYGAISPSVCFPLMQGPLGEGSLPLGHGAEVAVMPPGGGRRGGGSCPIQHPAINRGRRAVICSINTAPRLVSHRWERRGAEKPRARRGGGPPAAWERGEEGFQHLPPQCSLLPCSSRSPPLADASHPSGASKALRPTPDWDAGQPSSSALFVCIAPVTRPGGGHGTPPRVAVR